MSHTLFITGAAGYVGAMLCDQFSKRPDVAKIVALDKAPRPDLLKSNGKVVWIEANTAEKEAWWSEAQKHAPDVVIHAAWHIREMYGNKKTQWRWNVAGSQELAAFAFATPSVKRFIHFSSAAVYGAYPTNTIEHRFTEDEPATANSYLYAVEKRVADENLVKLLEATKSKGGHVPQVFVVRPAAITGPRGRAIAGRFGLQSALMGNLKGSFVYTIVRTLASFVPATKLWCRQFVHEDDVNDIIGILSFNDLPHQFEIFNLTPPGAVVRPEDMAKAVKKRMITLPPTLIRLAFFFFWHITRGRIPTSSGSWRFYSYPVVMDGTKVTRLLGHTYKMESRDAFVKNEGRYATTA